MIIDPPPSVSLTPKILSPPPTSVLVVPVPLPTAGSPVLVGHVRELCPLLLQWEHRLVIAGVERTEPVWRQIIIGEIVNCWMICGDDLMRFRCFFFFPCVVRIANWGIVLACNYGIRTIKNESWIARNWIWSLPALLISLFITCGFLPFRYRGRGSIGPRFGNRKMVTCIEVRIR